MLNDMKRVVVLIVLTILLPISCIRDLAEGFDEGGPIVRYLGGRWQLKKVVTPSGEKTGTQIGYREILERRSNDIQNYDKIFRDDSLVATYVWLRTPAPTANARDMTVIVNYDDGTKRFYKIFRGPDPKDDRLEATGYLTQIGSAQDTVRYHYVRE